MCYNPVFLEARSFFCKMKKTFILINTIDYLVCNMPEITVSNVNL